MNSSITVSPTGDSVDTFDISSVTFTTPDATHLQVTMTVKNLSSTPVGASPSSLWEVFWSFGGTDYHVDANSFGPGVQTYNVGSAADGNTATPTGQFTEGANGTIVWTVNRSDVGNPPNAPSLTNTYAYDHGAIAGDQLYSSAHVDRAPDTKQRRRLRGRRAC